MTRDEEAAKQVAEWLVGDRKEQPQVKIKTRVTLRKFAGDDTSGEPIETVVFTEDDFPTGNGSPTEKG